MITRNRIISAIALLLLPIAIRFVTLYQFPFFYQSDVKSPVFAELTIPEPPTASAPITAPEPRSQGQVVVIDYAHTNQFFIHELEILTRALTTRGAITETYYGEDGTSLENLLKYASAYIVISPMAYFYPEEIRVVEQFVDRGGRLLVFTDPTRGIAYFDFTFPDVESANLLLSPYGIAFSGDYLYNLSDNESNFRNVKFTRFDKHPITNEIGMVVLYGAHSLSSGEGATALLTTSGKTVSSMTDKGENLAAMVLSTNGNVLAAGDFTFLTAPYHLVADNSLLVEHVAEFALGGDRTPNLANFPYLFKGDVALVPLGKTQITADLISHVAALQSTLKYTNAQLSIKDKKTPGNNILIGTAENAEEDILKILAEYDIKIGDSREYAIVPGIGKVGLEGSGALLFKTGKSGNTLILLADTSENLNALLSLFASGDISPCVIQGDIGICSLGSGGSFSDDDYNGTDDPVESEPEATATPAG